MLLIENKLYSDFKNINVGDTLIIKTNKQSFVNAVQSKYGSELIIKNMKNKKDYKMHSNALTDDSIEIFDGNAKIVVKNVKNVLVKRNGTVIINVSTTTAGNSGKKPEDYAELFTDLSKTLDELDKNSKFTITTGKRDPKKSNKGDILKNTIKKFVFHIRTISKNMIFCVLQSDEGNGNELDYKNKILSFYKNGFVNNNGVFSLKFNVIENKKVVADKVLSDIVDFEVGTFVSSGNTTADDLFNNKTYGNLMSKRPGLGQRIMGNRKDVGVLPTSKLLSDDSFQKNKQIEFTFTGKNIRTQKIELIDSKKYIGRIVNNTTIKLGNANYEHIIMKIEEKDLEKATARVELYSRITNNGRITDKKIGQANITNISIY